MLTADAGKLERLGYKSVDGAEEWVTVEVSDGAALIPFWIDLSDEGLYLLDGEEIDYRQLGAMSPSSIAPARHADATAIGVVTVRSSIRVVRSRNV